MQLYEHAALIAPYYYSNVHFISCFIFAKKSKSKKKASEYKHATWKTEADSDL